MLLFFQVTIQKVWRGFIGRQQAAGVLIFRRLRVTREAAALKIQTFWKKWKKKQDEKLGSLVSIVE